jgi:hypothetical protein
VLRFAWLVPCIAAFSAVASCGGDNNGGDHGSSSGSAPSACATPCTPGDLCYQPVTGGANCNGDWYCWSDAKWHCAPPDSGPPGGLADATLGDDSSGGTGDSSGGTSDATSAGETGD